jgi:hypothetical protein
MKNPFLPFTFLLFVASSLLLLKQLLASTVSIPQRYLSQINATLNGIERLLEGNFLTLRCKLFHTT